MTTPCEKFKNLMAGLQSSALTIAVLVGGGWTLYTFVALDLEKRAEKELFAQAQINIEIQAKQVGMEVCGTCLLAIVKISNTGKRNVFLDYREKPLSVRQVIFDSDGSSRLGEQIDQAIYDWGSRVLRSGETTAHPLFLKTPKSGIYFVQFRVPLPEAEIPEHAKAGGPPGKIYWSGAAGVTIVEPTSEDR